MLLCVFCIFCYSTLQLFAAIYFLLHLILSKKKRIMTFLTTNLNKEIITLYVNGLQCVCVCKILHVNLYMIQRNVFKVYKIDDQIWYTRNTALSETWQNGAPISLFSASWQDIIDGPVLFSHLCVVFKRGSSWKAMSSWGLKHPRHGAMTYLVKKTLRSAGESSMPNHFENIRAIHCY